MEYQKFMVNTTESKLLLLDFGVFVHEIEQKLKMIKEMENFDYFEQNKLDFEVKWEEILESAPTMINMGKLYNFLKEITLFIEGLIFLTKILIRLIRQHIDFIKFFDSTLK